MDNPNFQFKFLVGLD